MVKQWLESLSLEDRVLAVSTIDLSVVSGLREIFYRLMKTPNNETGRFKRIISIPAS